MNKDTLHKVALTIMARQKLTVKDLNLADIITGEKAVEIIKTEIKEGGFWTILCGGETNNLGGMAKVLGVPLDEYLDFCAEISSQLKNDATYLHPPLTYSSVFENLWNKKD